jgi:hypothetical protein
MPRIECESARRMSSGRLEIGCPGGEMRQSRWRVRRAFIELFRAQERLARFVHQTEILRHPPQIEMGWREILLLSHGILERCPRFGKTIEAREAEAEGIADDRVIGSKPPRARKVCQSLLRPSLLLVPIRAEI